MDTDLRYQIRLNLSDEVAPVARQTSEDPAIAPLIAVLNRHNAVLKCQYDAFADYVAEAERGGPDNYPLYAWTKATVDDPSKKAKYLKSFALHVEGLEVYPRDAADALEAELEPLIGGPIVVSMSRFDSNPANNPQMPERFNRASR